LVRFLFAANVGEGAPRSSASPASSPSPPAYLAGPGTPDPPPDGQRRATTRRGTSRASPARRASRGRAASSASSGARRCTSRSSERMRPNRGGCDVLSNELLARLARDRVTRFEPALVRNRDLRPGSTAVAVG